MKNRPQVRIYRNKLPHIQNIGHAFFVTFRLQGSIPKVKYEEMQDDYLIELHSLKLNAQGAEKQRRIRRLRTIHFQKMDELLHEISCGPTFLENPECAQICVDQLKKYDNKYYKLLAYTIMKNHVHILIDMSIQLRLLNYDEVKISKQYVQLDKVLQLVKGASARYCNQVLGRTGKFWSRESYDIYIRDEKMVENVVSYILENPVKAGIVQNWEEYKWSYVAQMNEA